MSDRRIEKQFVVAVPRERAWAAFTDSEQLRCWQAPVYEIDPRPGGKVHWEIPPWPPVDGEVVEVDEPRLLRSTEDAGMLGAKTEITVTFETVDGGTRITVTHAGFGDGPDWGDSFESHSLGWSGAIADLVLYLEQGVVSRRFVTPWRTTLGLQVDETPGGLRVIDVAPGGYGEEAGFAPGDVVVRIGGVPIFVRSDLWCVQYAHEAGAPLAAEFARGGELLAGHGRLRANVPTR
jgi:uncharacterized protein YndB with AHSA1/START domain